MRIGSLAALENSERGQLGDYRRSLLLTLRTIMCPSAADHDLFYRRFAVQAGLAFATIGAVLDLEVARFAIGINVIRDR